MPIVPLRRRASGHHQRHSELCNALASVIAGEVRFDAGSRALYATDASNYRHPPIGVVIPRDTKDVVETIAICRQFEAPVVGRGGGTGLAGQTCNAAVIIDFSKYMNAVLDLDPDARRIRVQPGTVLDDARTAAQRHALTYGPDPATHSHCTFGGMIANDSCGVHSVLSEFYGPGPRTDHQLEELEILTYDGARMRVGRTSDAEITAIISAGGRRGDIYRRLLALRDRYADTIRSGFPELPRRVSGYNLPALLPENGFNVAAALAGTECSCVTFLEATLALVPHFPARVLLVLGYPSVYEAADHVPRIREFRPVGCEGIDDRLIQFMKKKGLHPRDAALLPEGAGWLLVEFGGATVTEARDRAREAMEALVGEHPMPSMALLEDPRSQARVWQVRESGLGATAFVPGEPDSWPGWEDSAVPVDRVGDYLRDLRALLERYGYGCSLYGHFGQGCIHTRIDFRLTSRSGIDRYRDFTAEAADLVVGYGGSLSGEHGDGQSRADLLPKMYGAELMDAFREFKAIWDPDNRMNPGKVIGARARIDDLRMGAGYAPPRPKTFFSYREDGGDFSHAALRCVGIGKCRRKQGGTMCPSFMVTREEEHTTRGRAHLLFEMLQGDVITHGWKSEEVKRALELCLACKGCKSDCPVNVDMATYKAEFMAHYYAGRIRPRQAYAFGLIHHWARLASIAPRLVNFVTHAPLLGRAAKLAAGIAPARDIPRFAPRTFRSLYAASSPPPFGSPVILWADTFNNHFFPGTLEAAADVLESAGYVTLVPSAPLCCGRPLYDFGLLDAAKDLWRHTLDVLGEEIDRAVPVVVLEPSCAAAFRDELPNLFPDDYRAKQLARNTHTMSEFLVNRADYSPPRLERRALVQAHCQHQAVIGLDADRELWDRIGLEAEVLDSGCCGMAGPFGFGRGRTYDVSVAAGERVLLPAVRRADADTLILADGFSCREQIAQRASRRALHIAELLQYAARAGYRGGERPQPEIEAPAIFRPGINR